MKKEDEAFKEIKATLKNNPLILVGVYHIEGREICATLKKEKLSYIEVTLPYEMPYWEEIPKEIQNMAEEKLAKGEKVIAFCVKGNLPEEVLGISSYWYSGEGRSFSPLEQLDRALGKEISPYHRLISANSRGVIYAMREEAEKLLQGFGAKGRYKSMMEDGEISDFELEDYRQKFYDSGEVGMEKIPEKYRAGIGLLIKNIRKKDRAAQGITMEQETQAERAVLKSWLIGSITVVEMNDAKPAAVFDRLVETEKYGLLMLGGNGESYFLGPWPKVKKFEAHFSEGITGGEPPIRGYWKGNYSRPLVIDFVEGLEKVKEKKKVERKSDFFMQL